MFLALWAASLASNVGTRLLSVGAAWLTTGLSSSPLLVALVQAATTLPVFRLAVPAGALADGFDRPTPLLVAQGWLLLAAALLAGLVAADLVCPGSLLAVTYALGSCSPSTARPGRRSTRWCPCAGWRSP